MRDRMAPGLLLILLGIFFLLANAGFITGDYFLLFLSAGFLAAYFILKRSLGLLIPGLFLGAVGSFVALRESERLPGDAGALFLIFLGIAFLLIFAVHTGNYGRNWGERNWPLYPGIILITLGGVIYAGRILDLSYWPVFLILAGIVILLNSRRT